jgi:outer membrane lipoprotein-sorting protein
MNCRQCHEQLNAYLEGLLESSVVQRIESHLADCSDCRVEFEGASELVDNLTRDGQVSSSESLDIPVMDRILREQAAELRRLKMQRQYRWVQAGGVVAAAIVFVVFAGIWQGRPDGTLGAAEARLSAAAVMAKGSEAASDTTSVHIRARMRTLPRDNFASITGKKLVPIEMWKEFGGKGRWRIEKAGAVIVMDGTSTTVLKRPNIAYKLPMPTKEAFDTAWFHRIASVKSNLSDDLRSALATDGELKPVGQKDEKDSGRATVVVDIRSKLKDGDYVKNKFIMDSDNRRTYHFDRESGRLEGLEIHLQEKEGDALIFEITEIEYNQPIDPKVFTLELPDDVVFYEEPKVLPDNEKYARMTPQEAARAFFEACAQEDWEEFGKFSTMSPSERIKQYLGGLEVVSLGEPFRSGGYAGWYVPYEIKLKSGHVKKFNLALRKDNPAGRFMFDGGL